MADCWASCMIPFDWGLQYDPRGFVFISEMVSGVYVFSLTKIMIQDMITRPMVSRGI